MHHEHLYKTVYPCIGLSVYRSDCQASVNINFNKSMLKIDKKNIIESCHHTIISSSWGRIVGLLLDASSHLCIRGLVCPLVGWSVLACAHACTSADGGKPSKGQWVGKLNGKADRPTGRRSRGDKEGNWTNCRLVQKVFRGKFTISTFR